MTMNVKTGALQRLDMTGTDADEHVEIEAVNKAMQVLELLKELDGAGVTELANRLD